MTKHNIIDRLDEIGFLQLGLAELISSDVLTSAEACKTALDHLKNFKEDFPTSKKKDDPQLKKYLVNAECIIRRDLAQFKAEETEYILASPQTVADIEKSRKEISEGKGIEIDIDKLSLHQK